MKNKDIKEELKKESTRSKKASPLSYCCLEVHTHFVEKLIDEAYEQGKADQTIIIFRSMAEMPRKEE